MKHQPQGTIPLPRHVLQPRPLSLLFHGRRAEQLRVETDQLPVLQVKRPAIVAEERSILLEPRGIERRLDRDARLARTVSDVMIPRKEAHLSTELGEGAGRLTEISRIRRSVDRDVAEMHD